MFIKKILIIDDDKETVESLQKGLERHDFSVVTAFDGARAKTAVLKEKPDVVIVDLMMPVLDGWHFLRWLREEVKLAIPAIIVSAKDQMSDLKEGISKADTYLVKPIDVDDVLRAVRAVCALKIEENK